MYLLLPQDESSKIVYFLDDRNLDITSASVNILNLEKNSNVEGNGLWNL